jgi:hypothetical protein
MGGARSSIPATRGNFIPDRKGSPMPAGAKPPEVPGAELMALLYKRGRWHSANDGDMGPIDVALADYKVVGVGPEGREAQAPARAAADTPPSGATPSEGAKPAKVKGKRKLPLAPNHFIRRCFSNDFYARGHLRPWAGPKLQLIGRPRRQGSGRNVAKSDSLRSHGRVRNGLGPGSLTRGRRQRTQLSAEPRQARCAAL